MEVLRKYIESLVNEEDLVANEQELVLLFAQYDDMVEAEEVNDSDSGRIKELKNIYYSRLKKLQQSKKEEAANSKQRKTELLTELGKLVNSGLGIKKSFEKLRTIESEWNDLSDKQDRSDRNQEAEYSSYKQKFYHKIDIQKSFIKYDLEKNYARKLEVIEKLKHLESLESVNDVIHFMREYENEWRNIGPTTEEQWTVVRNMHHEVISKLYKRVNKHYKGVEQNHKEAEEKKRSLINELNELLQELPVDDVKTWNALSNKVRSIQDTWKKSGFAGKSLNKSMFEEYKALLDSFYEQRKEALSAVKAAESKLKEQKNELILKAEAIVESKNWDEGTKPLIQLQKDWKKVGAVNRRDEQKLWKKFRAVCDSFFNAKDSFFKEQKELEKEVQKERKAFLMQLESLDLPEKQEEAIETLKERQTAWYTMGKNLERQDNKMESLFERTMEAKFKKIKGDKQEVEELLFKFKWEGLKSNPNKAFLVKQERQKINDKRSKIKAELDQMDNNLHFFRHSKNAGDILKDIEKKQVKLKAEMEECEKMLQRLQSLREV